MGHTLRLNQVHVELLGKQIPEPEFATDIRLAYLMGEEVNPERFRYIDRFFDNYEKRFDEMMAERGFSPENVPDAVDSGATGHCVGCQPWMRRGENHTTEYCYYVGNAGRHDRGLLRRYDSDSDESSDSESSMPTLIPRVEGDDSSSDEESDWTSTTEEVTDDESVISHKIEAQNKNTIQIGNIEVVRSR